jgi:hypothetical protein
MTHDGGPDVLSDSGAAIVWDGRMLPGPWLTRRAVQLRLRSRAATRARRCVCSAQPSHRLPDGLSQRRHRARLDAVDRDPPIPPMRAWRRSAACAPSSPLIRSRSVSRRSAIQF